MQITELKCSEIGQINQMYRKSKELFRGMLSNSGFKEAADAQNKSTLTAERQT